jgi:hypothetical protein
MTQVPLHSTSDDRLDSAVMANGSEVKVVPANADIEGQIQPGW